MDIVFFKKVALVATTWITLVLTSALWTGQQTRVVECKKCSLFISFTFCDHGVT
jgi:hypothetical protein